MCIRDRLGLDSASIAEVTSMLVTNNGVSAAPHPADASPVISPPLPDAYADPLDIDLLDDTIALGPVSYTHLDVYKRQAQAHRPRHTGARHAVGVRS